MIWPPAKPSVREAPKARTRKILGAEEIAEVDIMVFGGWIFFFVIWLEIW